MNDNLFEEDDLFNDVDNEEPMFDSCPNCNIRYDEIDYEYQICHICKYNANS